jgi:hypothetical protein
VYGTQIVIMGREAPAAMQLEGRQCRWALWQTLRGAVARQGEEVSR